MPPIKCSLPMVPKLPWLTMGLTTKGSLSTFLDQHIAFLSNTGYPPNVKNNGWYLPQFTSKCPTLCQTHHLMPSWIIPPGVRPTSIPTPVVSSTMDDTIAASTESLSTAPPVASVHTLAPVPECIRSASHVSTLECHRPCPSSQQKYCTPTFRTTPFGLPPTKKNSMPSKMLVLCMKSSLMNNTTSYANRALLKQSLTNSGP
jgi:hypothetical protein